MKSPSMPLVSIITPVYNGDKYLNECIESAINQTYPNWEYIILNNCSTDCTLQIAEGYSAKDERIRVFSNSKLVDALRNHNIALTKISRDSKYVKILHADDRLFPECIEKMVRVAEANPNVGVVGSYILYGKEIRCVGIPHPSDVVSGKDICRKTFRGEMTVFGPPSVTLIRSDMISNREGFYREDLLLADADVCFRLLMESDFGFVHQVLSCIRVHEESRTTLLIQPYEKQIPEMLEMLTIYGPELFDAKEFEDVLEKRLRVYYRFLVKNILFKKKEGFWDYHKGCLHKIGMPLSTRKLMAGLLAELRFRILNLQDSYEKFKARLA
jgi:glycosyltransferase involved in cell wall biosynthesis